MICPECGAEFREGFARCPDCNVGLVDALAAPVTPASAPQAAAAGRPSTPAAAPRPGDAPGWRTLLRWLLVAALAGFVALRLVGTVTVDFLSAGQSPSYYLVNAPIALGPAVVEALAVVLALRRRGGRRVWGALLACALALLAVQAYSALTAGGPGGGVLEGVALVALALLQFPRPEVAAGSPDMPGA